MENNEKRTLKMAIFCSMLVLTAIVVTYTVQYYDVNYNTKQSANYINIRLEDLKLVENKSSVDVKSAKLNGNILSINADLNNKGDNLKYEITINNKGNVPMYIKNIISNLYINGEQKIDTYPINVKYLGITNDEEIKANQTKKFNIILQRENIDNDAKINVVYNLLLEFTQK